MAKTEFKNKLSEAVEKMSYDVLPEARPEDFEITTVAAVSEPFADARVRNKSAKERFKKMIDAQTERAKKDLGLDKDLPERQANGNGKLVEAVGGSTDSITEAFKAVKWVVQDSASSELSNELQALDVYNERCYITATNLLYQRFNEAFKEAAAVYKEDYAVIVGKDMEESKRVSTKISLDENLFTPINEGVDKAFRDKSLAEGKKTAEVVGKKLTEAKIIMDAREYKPWQGAVNTYEDIRKAGKLDNFFNLLDDAYPSGIDEQALNDLLWFDADWIYEMLGIKNPYEADEEPEEEEEDSEE